LQTKIKRCNYSPGMYWHNGIDCSKRITKQFRKTEKCNKKLNVPVPYAVTQTPPWSCKVVFFITCVYCSGLLVSSCFTNKIKINMVSSLYYTFVENIRVRTWFNPVLLQTTLTTAQGARNAGAINVLFNQICWRGFVECRYKCKSSNVRSSIAYERKHVMRVYKMVFTNYLNDVGFIIYSTKYFSHTNISISFIRISQSFLMYLVLESVFFTDN